MRLHKQNFRRLVENGQFPGADARRGKARKRPSRKAFPLPQRGRAHPALLIYNTHSEHKWSEVVRNLAGVLPDVEIAAIAPLIAEIEALKAKRNARRARAQLHDAGHLPRRRGPARRLARPRPHGGRDRRRRDRHGGRPLHGRDRQDPESRQDRADPRPARRLLARRVHHRRRRAAAAPALPGRAGRHVCQHVRRGQGGVRHLLHVRQRGRGRRVARRRARDLPARPVPRPLGRLADRRRGHPLGRQLHGARALHGRAAARVPRSTIPGIRVIAHPECPPDVLGRGRLRRLDRRDDLLGRQEPAAARRDGHGVLDVGQRRRRVPRRRVRAALQPLPAHEAHHARRYRGLAAPPAARSEGRAAVAERARRAVTRMLAVRP